MTKDISKISEKDRSYFAGFFDGEGCVRVDRAEHGNSKSVSYSLAVSFGNTYAPTLYEIKEWFGGTICKEDMIKAANRLSVKYRDKLNTKNWKQSYNLILHGRDAWVFLKVIEPFCREKKEQVHVGIEFFIGRLFFWTIVRSQISFCVKAGRCIESVSRET